MKEYFEYDGLNYSTLSALDTNYPGNVFKEEPVKRVASSAMNRGSLVDCLLTSPDDFNELFIVADIPELSKTIQIVIDYMVNHDGNFEEDHLLRSAKFHEYGVKAKWSKETILKRLKTEETEKYYNINKKLIASDKIKISEEEYIKAQAVIDVLKTHEFSSWIFSPQEGVDVHYQLPIYWYEDGTPCKALLDILVVDHNKKIIRPIDLKVKADSKYAFKSSFMRYKYYLQASWYTRGLVAKLHPSLKDYKIENFTFLVTTFDFPEPPLLYRCSDELLTIAKYGGNDIKGVEQLFEDYKWYKEEGKFSYKKELHLSKGVIDLNF